MARPGGDGRGDAYQRFERQTDHADFAAEDGVLVDAGSGAGVWAGICSGISQPASEAAKGRSAEHQGRGETIGGSDKARIAETAAGARADAKGAGENFRAGRPPAKAKPDPE